MPSQSTCSIDGCERPSRHRTLCPTHYMRWRRHGDPSITLRPEWEMSASERFWAKVDKHGPVCEYAPELGACWLWKPATTPSGYGRFWSGVKNVSAHRWAYKAEYGLIPEGLEIDHLCRTRNCVRAAHLEAVTHLVNTLRGEAPSALNAVKTHCAQGHEFSLWNTYVYPDGRARLCKICRQAAQRERRRSAAL